MKNTNTSKTWSFDCFDGYITFNFTESVDIRKAFDAMRATEKEASWLDELSSVAPDTNMIDMGCEMYGVLPSECFISITRAIAETFPTVPFTGIALFSSFKCYYVISTEISYDGKTLCLTETEADETVGYMCPECGFQVAPYDASFEEDTMECDDCDEIIKVSDLVFVPPAVNNYKFAIHRHVRVKRQVPTPALV